MAKVPNSIEKLPKIATGREGARALQTTDRQTGTAYSEREREFTLAKN